jgi:hypothetical protein
VCQVCLARVYRGFWISNLCTTCVRPVYDLCTSRVLARGGIGSSKCGVRSAECGIRESEFPPHPPPSSKDPPSRGAAEGGQSGTERSPGISLCVPGGARGLLFMVRGVGLERFRISRRRRARVRAVV